MSPQVGTRMGVQFGMNAPSSSSIPGVTRDALNQNYYPADATEWTAFRSGAGLTGGNYSNPASTWNLQEAAGNYTDSIGGITLSELDPGTMLHQVAVTGTTRKGTRGTDGTSSQRAINFTTAPDASTTDILVIMYLEFPGAAPAANRDVAGIAASATVFDILLMSTGVIRLQTSATVDGSVSVVGTRGWFAYRSRVTAPATATLFTPAEKLVGTAATPFSSNFIWFGGQTGLSSATICAYMAQFTGGAARLTDAELKTMMQRLGETVLWS